MTEKETCVESETTMVSTYHRIGIFQNQFTKVLHDGISRIGLPEVRIVTTPKEIENYQCDIVLLADDDTSMWKEVYEMCEYLNIPVMFIFNFGIGSCVTIKEPRGGALEMDARLHERAQRILQRDKPWLAQFRRRVDGECKCQKFSRNICPDYGGDTYADSDGTWSRCKPLSEILSAFDGQPALTYRHKKRGQIRK